MNNIIPIIQPNLHSMDINKEQQKVVVPEGMLREVYKEQHLLAAAIINSSADAIMAVNLEGRFITWNRGAEKLLGFASPAMIGQDISAIIPPVLLSQHALIVDRIKKGETIEPYETLRITRDNDIIGVVVRTSPVLNSNGMIIGISQVATAMNQLDEDVVSHKSDSEELSLTKRTIENAAEGIIITDATMEHRPIIFANPAFYKITGYTREEVIGMTYWFLQGPDFDQEKITEIKQALDEKRAYSGELINYRKDGTPFWTFLNIVPLIGSNGITTHFAGFLSDITERKNAEAGLETLNESLEGMVRERTEELQEVNKDLLAFSYTVSHDLQTPLRTISAFSKMLSNEYKDKLDETGMRYVHLIEKSSKQMINLIRDLLNFSKLGKAAIHYNRIDMNEQVVHALGELSEGPDKMTAGIIHHHLQPAVGDAKLVKQVWLNLLANAVKYSSKKERPVVEIGMHTSSEETVYFVKDNGIGFDMQQANRLFHAFQRMHDNNEFEGTGIGLATVYRIVTKHGGRIWADAKENEGATFFFTLGELEQLSFTHNSP